MFIVNSLCRLQSVAKTFCVYCYFVIKTKTFNLSRFFRLHSSLMRSQIYTQHRKNTARFVWAILTGQMKQCRHKFDLIDAFINRTQLSVFRLVFCISWRKKKWFWQRQTCWNLHTNKMKNEHITKDKQTIEWVVYVWYIGTRCSLGINICAEPLERCKEFAKAKRNKNKN